MESDEYIRISEASKRSGIPATTLYSAIAKGTLLHKVQLGLKVVRLSDVLRYKETIKPGNPSPGPRRAKPSPIPEDN
jgi:predicted DNA-binding transcriptional regulator AlpA